MDYGIVTVAEPVFPSLVAMIDAVPFLTAVTTPVEGSTVALAVLLLDHTIDRPVRTLLLASFSTAVACDVPPTASVDGLSVTAIVATGATVTVSVAKFDFVSL